MVVICNFDGLVGSTHNYAGLSRGNNASIQNKNQISNPQNAVLQGLHQMKMTLDIVGLQGFLPPHQRPNFKFLYKKGFGINEAKALEMAYKKDPMILSAAWSASAMWVANAATVTCTDKNHVHTTTANLLTMRHRHQEMEQTALNLKHIFHNSDYFTHHTAGAMPDEGAANYMPLVGNNQKIYDIFVYSTKQDIILYTKEKAHYPIRQSLGALQQIAKQHHCANAIFLEQSVAAVNAGAFHNDVVAVSHDNCIIYHEDAFTNDTILPDDIIKIKIPNSLLPLQEAIETYIFNMRIVTNQEGNFHIIASTDVENSKNALKAVDFIMEHNPKIKHISFVDLTESMANGGGSACLRLRVPIVNPDSVHQGYLLNDDKISQLSDFVKNNYRDRVCADDLQDIDFANEAICVYSKLFDLIEKN